MSSITDGRHEIELSMSNFDHSIDSGLLEALRADPAAYAHYAARNFCAYVCVFPESDEVTCEVWRYGQPIKTERYPTLQDVMHDVSEEFGWE